MVFWFPLCIAGHWSCFGTLLGSAWWAGWADKDAKKRCVGRRNEGASLMQIDTRLISSSSLAYAFSTGIILSYRFLLPCSFLLARRAHVASEATLSRCPFLRPVSCQYIYVHPLIGIEAISIKKSSCLSQASFSPKINKFAKSFVPCRE